MEIAGLPLHPLLVHAVVVFVPLSALAAIALAVVPRWRWLLRWPTAAVTVVGAGLAWLATQSGEALLESRPELEALVEEHEEYGELLVIVMAIFAVLVVISAWSLGGASPLTSGRGGQESRIPALEKVLPILLVLGAIGVAVVTVLVGDSGARAVWG